MTTAPPRTDRSGALRAPAGRRPSPWAASLRRLGLAVSAGVLLWAGHPPVDLGAAGWVAIAPLLLLARDLVAEGAPRRVRGAGGWGLLAGLVFFVPLLEWLSPFGGLVPWLVVALIQAATVAAFVTGVVVWGERPGRAAMAAVWWVALEAVRGAVPLGGFPWGLLGYTQHDGGPLLPLARTLGVLGVSLACAGIAAAVAELVLRARSGPRALAAPAAALVAIPVLATALGGAPPAPSGTTLDVAAVQGARLNETGAAGINREGDRVVAIAERMLAATRPLAADPPALTVWPENSLDSEYDDPANTVLRSQAAEARALLDGRPLFAGGWQRGPTPRTHHNVMAEVTADGLRQVYRKQRVIPVGEYVPLRPLLELYPLAEQLPASDALPGGSQPPVTLAGARIAVAMCFDSVFPAAVRDQVRQGTDLLLVSTNNTSYGGSMSRQHLAFSQLRAVEAGKHVVHAGISGISGMIDPRGRVSQQTERLAEAVIRADVPLVRGDTPYTRLGDVVGPASLILSALGMAWTLLGGRRRVG